MKTEVGDKVRLKRHGQVRGIVERIVNDELFVRLEATQQRVKVGRDEVTNFSLAARKAWATMPERRVGRPKGLKLCDRVSVTLRIDRDLWEDFRAKEALGIIDGRTAAINRWLREKLAELEPQESAAKCRNA